MHIKVSTSYKFLVTVFIVIHFKSTSGALTDYINKISSFFAFKQPQIDDSNVDYTQHIPYEVSIADEKFISEAAKLTGVALSELDSCQQRVVLKLKTDCHQLNDEQLAKLSVYLLNCQSYVEGRPIYPCTDDMTIKACTINMDSDTWTSYHLMSNRARAVCYSIRNQQFRGLAELTINKLMETSQHQLQTLREVVHNQEDLQGIAENTLDSLTKGHMVLSQQQRDIQQAQFHGQLVLEDNIARLLKEKQLILEAHSHLVELTKKIQNKLETSSMQLEAQMGENRVNHQELLDDLVAIQNKAQVIFHRIEDSSQLLLKQNHDLRTQYQATLKNLAEVNATVHTLVTLVGGTRQALEDRLAWLTTTLGGTDLAIERLYLIFWHCALMMVSMLTCAFLSARTTTRMVVATLPPLNLAVALLGSESQLGPLPLVATILVFVLGQAILLSVLAFRNPVAGAIAWKKQPVDDVDSPSTESSFHVKSTVVDHCESTSKTYISRSDDEEDDEFNTYGSPTPPASRSGFYRPKSRSTTPLSLNGSLKRRCLANTRLGTPCKLTTLPGRDYCHRHQTGDSVMG